MKDLHDAQREEMVRRQIERRGIRDARVLAAMRAVPRHEFVSKADDWLAYDDHPVVIGEGQTIPWVLKQESSRTPLSTCASGWSEHGP